MSAQNPFTSASGAPVADNTNILGAPPQQTPGRVD
jgi:hypothetical protein